MGTYVDYDEYLTCLRKHGITPPPIARALIPATATATVGGLSGALTSFGLYHQQQQTAAVAAAATKASGLRAAL